MIRVFDHVLQNPQAYRAAALAQPFASVDLGQVFHGIALPPDRTLAEWFEAQFPDYRAELSFFRKSPRGQVEPNDIHNDVDMGDLTAILYLNPTPPKEDGTYFWHHRYSDARESVTPLAGLAGTRSEDCWALLDQVRAQFNRCVVFTSSLFHSRAIAENYGDGDDARLIQVLFGRKRGD